MRRGWKWVWRITGVLLAVVLVLGVVAYRELQSHGFFRDPVFETARPDVPELGHPAVLVFSKTNAYIHKEAIPAARAMFADLAREQGWQLYVSDSGAVFNPADLARFDAVVWNNVTGDVLLSEQREAFRTWLEAGGGYLGIHAAGDDSHDVWPWYVDHVVRAHFIGHPLHPQFQQALLVPDLPADPIVAGVPEPWLRTDEWYSFAASPRAADLRVLVSIDEASYAPEILGRSIRMGDDHPMIWKHCVGSGRVVYSAPGHTAESFAEPGYRALLGRALRWVARMDATPPGSGTLACEQS